jgi:hypothetical protein
VIDKQKKKSIISQKQQNQNWQSKDNPNGIGSSKAFEAPVVTNGATDNLTTQADAVPTPTAAPSKLPSQSAPNDASDSSTLQADDVPIPTAAPIPSQSVPTEIEAA